MVKPWAHFSVAILTSVTAAAAAGAAPPVTLLAPWCAAQAADKASVHGVLSAAVECYRKGDYEQAVSLLEQAKVGQNDLTPTEVNDLNDYLRLNAVALQARKEGAEQVRKAAEAVRAGRQQEAATLLRAATANQYLSAPDKQLATELSAKLRAGQALSPPEPTAAKVQPPLERCAEQAHAALREARALLARGDCPAARAKALAAAHMGYVFIPTEDTPQKVLADIDRAGKPAGPAPVAGAAPAKAPSAHPAEARVLLAASRKALERGDLDEADRLATAAEKAEAAGRGLPGWLRPWSDTPAKVRRDVQAARAARRAATAQNRPAAAVRNSPTAAVKAPAPAVPAGEQPRLAAADPTAAARTLLADGRKALRAGDLDKARAGAEKARALHPELQWWEDNPDKLLTDVRRVQDARAAAAGTKKTTEVVQVSERVVGAEDAKPAADARALLRQARARFNEGKLDEAEKLGQQAGAVPKTRWGLFEDTPEKLRIDVSKLRRKREQEESMQVLAEARKLFARGDLKEARSKAYLAQRLHGPYSFWDLGDRPDKLVQEINAAEARNRRAKLPAVPPLPHSKATDVPAPALAQDHHDAAPTAEGKNDPRAAQAKEWLGEARAQYQKGNFQVAADLEKKVASLNPGWDTLTLGPAPWGAELSVLHRDLEQATQNLHAEASPPGPVVIPPAPASQPPAQVEPQPPAPAEPEPPPPAAPEVTQVAAPAEPGRATVEQDLAKQRARMLLADAHKLQSQGRLSEAREKALEAQKAGAAFGTDEERPETVLLQLLGLCDKRIAALMQHAEDCVQDAAGHPERFRQADEDLQLAKKLSTAFGLDTLRVDNKMAWMQGQRDAMLAQGGAPPSKPEGEAVVKTAGEQPVKAPAQPATPQEQGQELLAKARLELKNGQTNAARRFAVAAFTGPYGIQEDATKVLRSIDAEEHNQAQLAADKSAEAGFAAFDRHDYTHAARIFQAIDVKMLSADRAQRLQEVMSLPEMQPAVLAKNDATAPGAAHAGDTGDKPNFPLDGPEGKAKVTDLPVDKPAAADNMAERVLGMQEIKFQELHAQGRQVQRDAMATFKAGDMDKAIQILMDYEQELEGSNLEPAKVALLKRPIDDRLQKLKTLRVQREFDRDQLAARVGSDRGMTNQVNHEHRKQEQVAEIMKQYHALYKDGKYAEAEMTAQKALELDPDNVAAAAAFEIARTHKRLEDYHGIHNRKEADTLGQLNDAEDPGVFVGGDEPLAVNKKFHERNKKRHSDAFGLWPKPRNATERAIENRLRAPISLNFKNTKLSQVIEDLHDLSGVNVIADKAALDEAGISLDREVDLKVENISLKSALNVLLSQIHLTYVIKDEMLQITTEDNAKGKQVRVVYPVADLVVPVESHTIPHSADIQYINDKLIDTMGAPTAPGGVTPYTGPFSLTSGSTVGQSSAGGQPSTASLPTTPLAAPRAPGQTIEEVLMKLITSTVAPSSWTDVGGPGTIQYFPLGLALVINQTPDIQEQVAELLDALRRLQDLEVSVELRMISVSESFFERIGVDFDINIVNSNHRFDNNLLTGQFQQPGFINKFQPQRFISGLTPAGTLTPDLNIPLTQNSFNLTAPPFGYTGMPGADGGLSLGLAFLSDIQVFMFLEAAQGDRRVNVMQAPKLTMFNGQTATLTVVDQPFFLTNVIPSFTPSGQLYFVPANLPFPVGVSIAIQPVITADRRFVRMNLNPTMANLTDATVPLFPVQVPVPQVFEGGATGPGQFGLFEIFLQQPKFETITISTTVSVPDGGTVLLGGLKTLNEGRSEFGPPILSKIPYINRLFRNVGYGKDVQSLMIMVTPRIIINEEEEIRQTGGPGGVPEEGVAVP
jgi:type II secretory pathway component GspD/PulD (secretin)